MTKKHTAKHLFLSLLFLITNFYLYASSSLSFSITGKVIDENKEPIPCVSVAARSVKDPYAGVKIEIFLI